MTTTPDPATALTAESEALLADWSGDLLITSHQLRRRLDDIEAAAAARATATLEAERAALLDLLAEGVRLVGDMRHLFPVGDWLYRSRTVLAKDRAALTVAITERDALRARIVENLLDVPLHEHSIREAGERVLWLGMTYAEAVAAVDAALATTAEPSRDDTLAVPPQSPAPAAPDPFDNPEVRRLRREFEDFAAAESPAPAASGERDRRWYPYTSEHDPDCLDCDAFILEHRAEPEGGAA